MESYTSLGKTVEEGVSSRTHRQQLWYFGRGLRQGLPIAIVTGIPGSRRHRFGKHEGQRSPAIQFLQQGGQAIAARPAAQRNHGSPAAGTFWFRIGHLSSGYKNAINKGKDVKPKRPAFPCFVSPQPQYGIEWRAHFRSRPLAKRVAGFHDEGTT